MLNESRVKGDLVMTDLIERLETLASCNAGFDEGDTYRECAAELSRLTAERDMLVEALKGAENLLSDYILTLEKAGASLNYGKLVLKLCREALAKVKKP
jgi:hypothetical protein